MASWLRTARADSRLGEARSPPRPLLRAAELGWPSATRMSCPRLVATHQRFFVPQLGLLEDLWGSFFGQRPVWGAFGVVVAEIALEADAQAVQLDQIPGLTDLQMPLRWRVGRTGSGGRRSRRPARALGPGAEIVAAQHSPAPAGLQLNGATVGAGPARPRSGQAARTSPSSPAMANARRRNRYSRSSWITATPPHGVTWPSARRMRRRFCDISGIAQARAGQPGSEGSSTHTSAPPSRLAACALPPWACAMTVTMARSDPATSTVGRSAWPRRARARSRASSSANENGLVR